MEESYRTSKLGVDSVIDSHSIHSIRYPKSLRYNSVHGKAMQTNLLLRIINVEHCAQGFQCYLLNTQPQKSIPAQSIIRRLNSTQSAIYSLPLP